MSSQSIVPNLSDLAVVGRIHLEHFGWGSDAARFLLQAGTQIIPSRNGPYSVVSNIYDTLNPLSPSGVLEFHTDGLYCKQIPDFVVFYCEEPGDLKCHTSFADTRLALQQIKDSGLLEQYKELQIAYIFDSPSERIPLITDHPLASHSVIHLASNYSRNEHIAIEQSIAEVYRALEKSIVYQHTWKRGDLLIFDNHSFVHRRQSTREDSGRRLIRLWLSGHH